jgi:RND superfamily putative drug exporter
MVTSGRRAKWVVLVVMIVLAGGLASQAGTLLLVAGGLVLVLLIIIYRSPIFWVIPFFTVLMAEASSRGIGYLIKQDAGGDVLVGGQTAAEYDLRTSATRDNKVVIPVALAVVFVILSLLLRALLGPLLLVLSTVLSFGAALGFGIVVFNHVLHYPGEDPSLPLLCFVFLVALGIDYNIFLMARVREETHRFGTREGMVRGLAVTGTVITSAGIVLAGTFGALAVLPLVTLTEVGVVIAFGVLLDTFVVRSIIVPALVFDIGPRIWWPSRLAREHRDGAEAFERGLLRTGTR